LAEEDQGEEDKMLDNLKRNVSEIRIYSFSLNQEIAFPAFLTDFSDTFTANWNSQEIYGRMDPIYTYKNTVRKINLSFDVPSLSVDESISNGKKSEHLINSLYPVYEDKEKSRGTATIGSPPLVRIKFANLIYRSDRSAAEQTARESGLLGWIDNFSFKPELDSGFYVVEALNKLYPKLYKVTFNFNVIHEHALGYKVEQDKHIPRLLDNTTSENNFAHGYGLGLTSSSDPINSVPPIAPPPLPVAPPATNSVGAAIANARAPVNTVPSCQGSTTIATNGTATKVTESFPVTNGDTSKLTPRQKQLYEKITRSRRHRQVKKSLFDSVIADVKSLVGGGTNSIKTGS
jgi:hypothetical protein